MLRIKKGVIIVENKIVKIKRVIFEKIRGIEIEIIEI
jgi:hypothetical protein